MPRDAAEAQRWLEKAIRDRRTAKAALEQNPPITDTAAFHAQQAAEKLLKGFLVYVGVEFEKTHDLEPLCDLCARREPAFKLLTAQVARLTAYAVRFRYPGPADPTLEQVESALRVVEQLELLVSRLVVPEPML